MAGRDNLIVCFGGCACKMGGILPFEFVRYLSSQYSDRCDLLFYVDRERCWYHRGLKGLTTNVDNTAEYLALKISGHTYKKVVFMGVSAGGYAAILFGSLCNASNVIAFIPQTTLKSPHDKTYANLETVLNNTTDYDVYGDPLIAKGSHDYAHCTHLGSANNVQVHPVPGLSMTTLRDQGTIRATLDAIMGTNLR